MKIMVHTVILFLDNPSLSKRLLTQPDGSDNVVSITVIARVGEGLTPTT